MSQIKTKDRVRDLGEVYTNEREVRAMMDLVKETGYDIDARFLEPACGNGNFLEEILNRKLETVSKMTCNIVKFEYSIIKSVSSIYGIDICMDNVNESRDRLFGIVKSFYSLNRNTTISSDGFYDSLRYVLEKNIILGDFINGQDNLIFSEFKSRSIDKVNCLTESLFNIDEIKQDIPKALYVYPSRKYNELTLNAGRGLERAVLGWVEIENSSRNVEVDTDGK